MNVFCNAFQGMISVFQSYFLFWDVCESSDPVGQVLHFAFLGGSLGFR
jgi:hypothetical protein